MPIGLRQKLTLLHIYLVLFNVLSEGLNSQVSRGRYYFTVQIQSSGNLCISNSPSAIIKSISVKQCTLECFHQAGCDDFNVIDGGTGIVDCQLYVKKNPLDYTVKANCRAYQAEDKPCSSVVSTSLRAPSGPTGNLVPARCCSFPFSLNGVINYRCVINSTNVDVGCYLSQRTWATCLLPTDFTSQYVTYNITMPGNSSVGIPVQSVNSWIVIHKNVIGGVTSFIQNWLAYKNGFGNDSLSDNFWLGNELVNRLTSAATYSLRVEVQRPTTLIWQSVEYSSFRLSSESTKYTLSVTGFSGDTVDAFNANWVSPNNVAANGMSFTTFDSDNDVCTPSCNCASPLYGGWWYGWCSISVLTAVNAGTSRWYHDVGQEMYVADSRMMIRLN